MLFVCTDTITEDFNFLEFPQIYFLSNFSFILDSLLFSLSE